MCAKLCGFCHASCSQDMVWKSSHFHVFCADGPVFVVITQNLFRWGLTGMQVIPVIYSKVLNRRGKDEK